MRKRRLVSITLLLWGVAFAKAGDRPAIHAVVDLAHSFSFYFDGQYLKPIGGRSVNSFCALSKCSFDNLNLDK